MNQQGRLSLCTKYKKEMEQEKKIKLTSYLRKEEKKKHKYLILFYFI